LYALFLSFKLFNLTFKAYKAGRLEKIGLVDTSMDSNLERRPVSIASERLKFAPCRPPKSINLYSYQEILREVFIAIWTIFGVYAVHFLEITEHHYSTIQVFRIWGKAGKANGKVKR
jgi:hypothetical protein